MFAYVARQPIVDKDSNVYGYELLFRDGKSNCFPDIEPDEATSKLITGSHLALGIDEIAESKLAFINFYTDTLLYRFPTSLDPMNVIIEIVETVKISPQLVSACQHIRELGYKFALDDHDFDPKWDPFLKYTSIVKIDISDHDFAIIEKHIPKYKEAKVKLIAERVETLEQFKKCEALGFDYFQGYFFARPEVTKQKTIPSSKMNLMQLMQESASINFDFEKISTIIQRDVALSHMLLRFINNPIMNKRHKITSLNHAITYMGQVEVKKFIALLALANLADDKPPELVHMSLVRAKFCELIAVSKKEVENPPKGFLVGLFSLLDALLNQEMGNIMGKLPLSDDLKEALCGDENRLRDFLSIARAFEYSDWAGVKRHANRLKLDQRLLHSFYNESVKWGAAMTRSIRV